MRVPFNSILTNQVARGSSFEGRIGAARVDITPPVGIYARVWGASQHDVAESIHRQLTVGAMVFLESADRGLPLILIEADLGFNHTPALLNEILTRVAVTWNVPAERVIFTVTHTHSGPRNVNVTSGVPGGELLTKWREELVQKILQAVQLAIDGADQARLEWHYGVCRLASERDFPDPNGGRRLCGFHPQGQADQTLLVGRVVRPGGQITSVIVNYACHPTTLAVTNRAISPDFIGALRETVATALSGSCSVFFLQGASGELAPRYQYVSDPLIADRHGRHLAYAVLATLEDMEPPGTALSFEGVIESGAPLAIWRPVAAPASTTLEALTFTAVLPLKDLPTTREIEQQIQGCEERAIRERLRRQLDIRAKVGEGANFHLPVHGWRIGSACLIGTMAEAYSLFQIQLRSDFADRHLACLNLVNGCIGYLAPKSLYEEDIYQVWQSPFACGGLEETITTSRCLVQELSK